MQVVGGAVRADAGDAVGWAQNQRKGKDAQLADTGFVRACGHGKDGIDPET
jgi:hypothetical protein